jgi:hypothetical protein
MATSTADKVRENRLRRMAQRRGYLLIKSRRRDPGALDYGLFVLVDDTAGNRVHGAAAVTNAFDRGEGMTLDDVEEALSGVPTVHQVDEVVRQLRAQPTTIHE